MPENDKNPSPSDAGRALGALGASKGGKARADSLSAEERAEIAKKAADARWGIPAATHEGELKIGEISIPCAVLEDGRRVLTQAGFLGALGRHPKANVRYDRQEERVPPILQGKAINPFIPKEILSKSAPVPFRTPAGGRASGYDASLLPAVCEVYLKAREAGVLPRNQRHVAKQAEILMRALAHVGIIALVDEATGYQEVRARLELHKILDAYIAKELLPWAKMFPDEFYKQMFRLRGWQWSPMSVQRPPLVGLLTKQVVYMKLPEGVLEELERVNPVVNKGRRRRKHHQHLTKTIGNPHLDKHLAVCTALMRVSKDWKSFRRLIDKAVPTPGPRQGELFDNDATGDE